MTTNGRTGNAMVPLAGLYESTSQRTGKTYFTGYLGKAKVLLLQNDRAGRGRLAGPCSSPSVRRSLRAEETGDDRSVQ